MNSFAERIQEFDRNIRYGTLKDRRTFKVVITDDRFWMDHIRGLWFKRYEIIGSISNRDLINIQARIQA